jgi:putative lipoprotein
MPVTDSSSPSPLGRVIGGVTAVAFVVVILFMIFGPKSPPAEPPAETPAELPAPAPEPAPVPAPSPPATATLTGTVTYRQRIALPPEAIVTVRLEDTSLADAPAVPVVQYSFGAEGRQVPLPFEFTFDPASIKDGNTYSVRASIEIEGELRWTSTTAYHVLTRGNPSQVDIVVDPVNAAPPEPPPANATRLRDTEWMLVEFDGRPVPPPVEGGRAPMIVFATEGSAVSAQGHCNRHFGSFEADDAAGTLVIRMVGSTKMGCPNEVMMEEAEFLAALGRVAKFTIDGETLTLEGGNAVARFAAVFANK